MATTPRKNAALVQGFLTDVVAGGDTDAVGMFLAETVMGHNLVFGGGQGRDAMTALGWRVFAGADVDIDIKDVMATGETVTVRATVTGAHRESLMDLIPTGASFEIAEIWSLPDGLGLMQQLGALPKMPPDHSLPQPTEHQ